jgi:hypothetical protein
MPEEAAIGATVDPGKEYTVREAAQQRGTLLTEIYRQLWCGRLTGYKINGQWRIPGSSLNQQRKK